MERVIVVLDYIDFNENLFKKYGSFDYKSFLDYLSNLEEERKLIDAYGYIKLDFYNEGSLEKEIADLESSGFLIKRKISSSKEEIDNKFYEVEVIIEILRNTKELNVDIIVFLTTNTMFYPLFKVLRDMGIRIEIVSIEDFSNEKLKGISQGVICADEFLNSIETKKEVY